MISLTLSAVVLIVSIQAPVAPRGQVAPQIEQCLHGSGETAIEKARRAEALAAMRMIDWAITETFPLRPPGLEWKTMTDVPAVRDLRGKTGEVGELARKLQWGAPEPLPGWNLSWLATPVMPPGIGAPSILFALTDTRDPCRFRYDSADPDVIPAWKPGVRLLDKS